MVALLSRAQRWRDLPDFVGMGHLNDQVEVLSFVGRLRPALTSKVQDV